MYNKSEIMKNAWTMRKSYRCRSLTFGECLKRAWAKAKEAIKTICKTFTNNMEITIDGYTRTLTRWTKGNHDRVYINGGSKKGDGYVDIKNGTASLRGDAPHQIKIADAILAMEF